MSRECTKGCVKALFGVASQAERHDGKSASHVHTSLAARHRNRDLHGRLLHDFGSNAKLFIAKHNQALFWPLHIVDARINKNEIIDFVNGLTESDMDEKIKMLNTLPKEFAINKNPELFDYLKKCLN